ncbi:Monoamine oxidase N [Exophiala dermatitidis]
MTSRDGFVWTPSAGGKEGIPSISVIEPQQHVAADTKEVLDAIVIGAGYSGLVAARDLTTQGFRTLLLEGRDRIGGRTWHSTIDGFNYEMGGTWVHWQMPHIYREMSLYNMQDEWIVTQIGGGPLDFCTLTTPHDKRNLTHDQEADMFGRVWGEFCNLDGAYMKEGMPYPFDSMRNKEQMSRYDKLSCRDRLEQIRSKFSTEEIGMLEAILLQMGGGPLESMGVLDGLRWWALGNHLPTGLNDIALSTRLRSGQSALARNIFDHAVSTRRLSYAFSSPVAKIEDGTSFCTVTTRSGKTYKAHKVICTIPLNVLRDIEFSPALPTKMAEAISIGQTNKCNKVHFDVAGPELVSWNSFASPGKGLICALADNLTPTNDTHLVAFGPSADTAVGLTLKDNISGIKEALDHLLPEKKEVKRIVYHDWYNDEFSKGTWAYLPPEWVSKYNDIMQTPHGNVILASGDWGEGWRGWIDGAAQQGMKAAKLVADTYGSRIKSRI